MESAEMKYENLESSFPSTQSWQHWHFCTTSNGNKLKTIKYQIRFRANLHLSWYHEVKLRKLISSANFVSKLSNTEMSTLSTLCITGKLE